MPASRLDAWFTSLLTLRYLEVNGIVPFRALSSAREVLTDPWSIAAWLPEGEAAIAEALTIERSDEARYETILRAVFLALSQSMPFPFSEASAPAGAILESGIVTMLCEELPERAFGRPEILGWVYQYYYATGSASRNSPVEDIGMATRLFTPAWMAEYLVESSLGSLSGLRGDSEFRRPGPDSSRSLDPSQVTVLDPACGSGHLLLRAYDVLYEMYRSAGWGHSAIPRSIIGSNLFGLDIDPRAAELASLSLTLRAALDDPSILFDRRAPRPAIGSFRGEGSASEDPEARRARILGSLWRPPKEAPDVAGIAGSILSRAYDCVIANPPFLANRLMPPELRRELKIGYRGGERDLFSAFILRSLELCKEGGRISLMTPYVWLFISSYAELRRRVLRETSISSLVQLEYSGFEDATVPVCCLSLEKDGGVSGSGTFVRLSGFRGPSRQESRAREAFADPACKWRYDVGQTRFASLPSCAFLFWLTDSWLDLLRRAHPLGAFAEGAVGLNTGDNSRFLRRWHEVAPDEIAFGLTSLAEVSSAGKRWLPYNKGGEFRKWSGNREWVIDWGDDGAEIKALAVQRNKGRHWSRYIQNLPFMLKPGITWSFVSSSHFGVRWLPEGFMFDVAGSCLFPPVEERLLVTAFLCSRAASILAKAINPTLNFQVGNVLALPYPREELEPYRSRLEELAREAISLSSEEWDERETSWDFRQSPLLAERHRTLEQAIASHLRRCETRRERLREAEAEIDRLIFAACRLPEVEIEPELTIPAPSRSVLASELLSYAVGCHFGRYSMDGNGGVLAGDAGRDACRDNLLPLSNPTETFDSMRRLLEKMFPDDPDPSDELSNALGMPLDRYLSREFYQRHVSDYGGRPIYLLFISGRTRAFQALTYTHRLTRGTLESIRDHHLPPVLDRARKSSAARRSSVALRELEGFSRRLERAIEEWRDVDLSLGVIQNHHRLRDVLAPIRRSVMPRD